MRFDVKTFWIPFGLVLMMAVGSILFLIPRAQAAPPPGCSYQVDRSVRTFNYDDDETSSYARMHHTVYTYACSGGRDIFRYSRIGYYPDRRWNDRLSCFMTRAFVINPSPVAGYNSGPIRLPCRANGMTVTRDFRNVTYRSGRGDRCFHATGYADKAWLPDPHFRTPVRCVS